MMKLKRLFPYVMLILLAGILSFAQESKADRATVPFSDPSRPGLVKVGVYNGAVTVKGYNGKEVVVEARVWGKMISEKKEVTIKAKGMKLIQVATTGLEIEEENNNNVIVLPVPGRLPRFITMPGTGAGQIFVARLEDVCWLISGGC